MTDPSPEPADNQDTGTLPTATNTSVEPLKLDYAAISDVGRYRKENQDSGYAGPHLLAVCDGVGGAVRGDLASATAMAALRSLDAPAPAAALDDPDAELTLIAGALHRAHDRIGELVEDDPTLNGTSTTATLGTFDGQRLAVGHVGDSRAYLLRDGEVTQLTKDHTFVQTLVDEGKITDVEARTHPHKNVILQAVDGVRDAEPDLFLVELHEGDRVLFCSDGACDVLPDEDFARLLAEGNPSVAAIGLIRGALDAGSTDNVTAVVADVIGSDTPFSDDSVDPFRPILVGAAAELPQQVLDRSGGRSRAKAASRAGEVTSEKPSYFDSETAQPVDPETARYAPRPPRRFRWLRVLSAIAIAVGIGWAGVAAAWHYTQEQFYVGVHQNKVTVFRGVDARILGFELSKPYEVSNLEISQLSDFYAKSVKNGMAEGGLDEARATVQDLASGASPTAQDTGTAG